MISYLLDYGDSALKSKPKAPVDTIYCTVTVIADVQTTIRFTLNDLPEEPYPDAIWKERGDAVWGSSFHVRRAAVRPIGIVIGHSYLKG